MPFVFVRPAVWNLGNGKQAQAGRNLTSSSYQCPTVLSILPPLGYLSLCAHAKTYISVQMFSSPHVSTFIHIRGRKSQILWFVEFGNHWLLYNSPTITALFGCGFMSGSIAHMRAHMDLSTGALFLPVAHTRANPKRGLFLAHINVSNQSGQGAL